MIKSKKLIKVTILFLGSFLFSFCSSSSSGSKGKIGMTCMDLTNPYFKLIAINNYKF